MLMRVRANLEVAHILMTKPRVQYSVCTILGEERTVTVQKRVKFVKRDDLEYIISNTNFQHDWLSSIEFE